MLEGVFNFREQLSLIQELGPLEPSETFMQGDVRVISGRLEQRKGHVLADYGRSLEQALILRQKAIDPRGEDRLRRRGNLQALRRSRQSMPAPLAGEHFRLNQRSHALLEEERIALCPRNQESLQRCQAWVTPKLRLEKFIGARRRQGVES